jgi:hypothetical protein
MCIKYISQFNILLFCCNVSDTNCATLFTAVGYKGIYLLTYLACMCTLRKKWQLSDEQCFKMVKLGGYIVTLYSSYNMLKSETKVGGPKVIKCQSY